MQELLAPWCPENAYLRWALASARAAHAEVAAMRARLEDEEHAGLDRDAARLRRAEEDLRPDAEHALHLLRGHRRVSNLPGSGTGGPRRA